MPRKVLPNIWVKLSVHESPVWINSVHVRRLEVDRYGKQCRIVYTSKDIVAVDQTLDEVMVALGYKLPPVKPLEIAHAPAPAELEDAANVSSGEDS